MALRSSGDGLSGGKLALANAAVGDVLSGKTFYSADKNLKIGAMTNHGAWVSTIEPGGTIAIPAGYHNGCGSITAGNKGKFLGYMEAIVNKGTQYYDSGSEYFSGKTFRKSCTVRIIGHTWSSAGTGMTGINVNLSGVGNLVDAGPSGNLRTVNNVYSVSPGQTLTANASAYYAGSSGYVVYLEE